jgi:hypothetical protein
MRALLVMLMVGCGVDRRDDARGADVATAPAGGPLATARPVAPVMWRGAVFEVVPAGSYVYLEVETEAGPRWVGTLALEVAPGQEVWVRPLAELDRYRSARTGRTFDHLQLAMVSAVPGT